MSKFKVGDIVKCVKNHDSIYCTINLKKAKVLDINTNEMNLQILEHSRQSLTNTKIVCTFENYEDYFELVENEVKSLYPKIFVDDMHNTNFTEICENLFDTYKKEKYIKSLYDDGQELCEYCIYKDKCSKGVSCYGNGPVYPWCADLELNDYIDYAKVDLETVKEFLENKEEEDMNKVVNLWYERKNQKIDDKYAQLENNYMLEHYSVLYSFNELIGKFNDDLESLYKMDKATEQFILKENAPNNVFKYCIDDEKLIDEAKALYETKKEVEKDKIREIKEEVEAQLSLSNDLSYQQEVLERYGIITKKTKKISE